MKKVLLLLIASLTFCGTIIAQHESHWADFVSGLYRDQLPVVAFVQIDNNFITADDNWADLEIAAFVDGNCRGHQFMIDETNLGDPYPWVMVGVFYNTPGETVTFKMYDHSSGIEYDDCICNITPLTGEKHVELYYDYDDAVILNFATPAPTSFIKRIIGYGEGEGRYYLIAPPIDDVDPAEIEGMITEDEANYDLFWFDQTEALE